MISTHDGLQAVSVTGDVEGGDTASGLAFGPFVLYPREHRLLRDGVGVNLGSRAMSLLVALCRRAGALVEKQELLALVWPKAVVEECNLRAQVVALRRALGEGSDGCYIATVPGRGYRFCAAITPLAAERVKDEGQPVLPSMALPALTLPMFGQEAALRSVFEQLNRSRLLTLTGPGGVGKTALALATAARWGERGQVSVLDLAGVGSLEQVQAMFAAIPATTLPSEGQQTQRLVVVDNVEPLLDAVAEAVHALLAQAAGCSVLLVSREPLHLAGEQVHAVAPLAVPAPGLCLTVEQARQYPAMALMLDRIAAHVPGFTVKDSDTETLARLCQQLDGSPLAIELAATRVRTFGLQDLLRLFDGPFRLKMPGRRTAPARHRTLAASLDFSYDRLSGAEQALLRRLGIFPASFSLAALAQVLTDLEPLALAASLEALVAKSMVAAFEQGEGKGYRLLHSTRLYALAKLSAAGEAVAAGHCHARYVRTRLEEAIACLDTLPADRWISRYAEDVHDVRSALEWAFADGRLGPGLDLALDLAMLSAPLWLRLSLLEECQTWLERGLQSLEQAQAEPTHRQMVLQAFMASLLTLAHGAGPRIRQAWQSVLDQAQALGDRAYEGRALWGLWNDRVCGGESGEAARLARRYLALAQEALIEGAQLTGKRMLAVALFYQADLAGARQAIGEALATPDAPRAHLIDLHFDQRLAARALKANVQLLEGHQGQALLTLASCLHDAIGLSHPATLWYCLCYAALPVALLIGNDTKAGEYLAMLKGSLGGQTLPLWWGYAQCFDCILQLRKAPSEGVAARLGDLLGALRERNHPPLLDLFCAEYAKAMAALGLPQWGLDALEHRLARAPAEEDHWFLAELLRVKARLAASLPGRGGRDRALEALRLARGAASAQGSAFWMARIEADLQPMAREQGVG